MTTVGEFQGRKLNFNDELTYRAAWPAPQNPDAPKQLKEQGPYKGRIVDFGDFVIGVRADGWMGNEPLYYLWPEDILSVVPWKQRRQA